LGEAEAEDQPAQPRQALERQFESHHEKKEHHAEGGDIVDRLDIGQREDTEPWTVLGKASQPVRTECGAGDEETENRRDAQPDEQRRDDACRRQKQQRLSIKRKIQRIAILVAVKLS
jgi:hypothetical protein